MMEHRRTASGCFLVPVMMVIIGCASWYWSTQHALVDQTPWVETEHVFHDNLARNLKRGTGFELDFGDAQWLSGYSQRNSNGQFDWIFAVDAVGPTTAHAPAVPFMMSASRRLTGGRDELAWGLFAVCFAVSIALLIHALKDWFGWQVALIATLGLVLDIRVQQSSGLVSGDSMVTALLILAFLVFIRGLRSSREARNSIWLWPIAGGLLGATTLFRIDLNLWLVLLGLFWSGYLMTIAIRRKPVVRALESSVLFFIGIFVVAAPWWVHNCKTTGKLNPIGNILQMRAVGGYSDAAWTGLGNLNYEDLLRHRDEVMQAARSGDWTLVELEAKLASDAMRQAGQWAQANRSRLPMLVTRKIGNHLGFDAEDAAAWKAVRAILWGGALFGMIASWRRIGVVVFALVLTSLIVTGFTWSDHGRLLLPIWPLVYALFAIGLVELVKLANRKRPEPERKD